MALIEVKNFSKSFGNKQVHQNVNIQLHQGECLGLVMVDLVLSKSVY